MWIIFKDPETAFNHLDKFVVDVVNDAELPLYQEKLHAAVGGSWHDVNLVVHFLQPFITSASGVAYFVRQYKPWIPLMGRSWD
jgi:hypothetical protein